jgi:hypothetical protein
VSDWLDTLNPDDRSDWDRFVEHTRRETLTQMDASAFVLSIVPTGGTDIKFAVELGLAIMLDKPLLAIVAPGAEVPNKLRLVANEVVEADIDVEEGRLKVMAALQRMRA